MAKSSNNYTFIDVAGILKGSIIQNANSDSSIRYILTDSRQLVSPENTLFFALTSKRNDGHKYIEDLYNKNVRNFIISKELSDIRLFPDANFLLVSKTLPALQMLSAFHRKKFSIPVIGITGSNGKTIVKEWLFQLLNEDKKIVRSPKSYNSQIGVPLSVWQMESDHELGIFEAGISEPNEMEKLQHIIQPTIGIFVNIGQAHNENFIHSNQKISEKLRLFTKVSTLIYCIDYLEIKERIVGSEALRNIHSFTWSRKGSADLCITNIIKKTPSTTISGIYKNETIEIQIPFSDDASIENAIHCWSYMLLMDYPNTVIAKRMLQLSTVAMRLELKEGINNCSVINDSYNSDLNSLSIAIDFLNQQKQHQKRTIILSDILQSGRDEDELYGEVSSLLIEKGINRIIGIGPNITRQKNKFSIEKYFSKTTEEFLNEFSFTDFHNETILLKGARVFEFENISKILQQKAHETVLEINLNGLIHNLNYYKSLLNPSVKVMAMVKAFSYGSGSYEIANILQYHQIDYLVVAYADEGIELRKAGITVPIMVMNPEVQSFDAMIKYNLEPEIFSFHVLYLLENALQKKHNESKPLFSIHIKLDTGMHRLGFESKDIALLIQRIKAIPTITIKSIFSHLAASDDAKEDGFTKTQIELFSTMSNQIAENFDYPILRHILNSAGISRFRNEQFDMVRLGIGLYGVGYNKIEQALLKNVSTLKTTISQIKMIPKGETIGYGRKWTADRNMRIATVPIGYADGLNRKLGNGIGKMMVNENVAPIVGSICMDMCMIDITDVVAEEGNEVVVFGESYPITQLAADLDTIPYEVLTSVSRRVKRVYYHE